MTEVISLTKIFEKDSIRTCTIDEHTYYSVYDIIKCLKIDDTNPRVTWQRLIPRNEDLLKGQLDRFKFEKDNFDTPVVKKSAFLNLLMIVQSRTAIIHRMSVVKTCAELLDAPDEDLIDLLLQTHSTTASSTSQSVHKPSRTHKQTYIYVRVRHPEEYCKRVENIREIFMSILKFGIAFSLHDRDHTYSDDNGFFIYAFPLSSRGAAKVIENYLIDKFQNIRVNNSREYIDAEAFAKSIGMTYQSDNLETYYVLAQKLFTLIVRTIKFLYQDEYSSWGYRYDIVSNHQSSILDLEHKSHEITEAEAIEYGMVVKDYRLMKEFEHDHFILETEYKKLTLENRAYLSKLQKLENKSTEKENCNLKKEITRLKKKVERLELQIQKPNDVTEKSTSINEQPETNSTTTPSVSPTVDIQTDQLSGPSDQNNIQLTNGILTRAEIIEKQAIFSRDLVTGKEEAFTNIEQAAKAADIISGKSFRKHYLDKPRQSKGKHWRSLNQKYWNPPDGLCFDPNTKGRDSEGAVRRIKPNSLEIRYYESVTEAGLYLDTELGTTGNRRKITDRLNTGKIFEGCLWESVPHNEYGTWTLVKPGPSTSVFPIPHPQLLDQKETATDGKIIARNLRTGEETPLDSVEQAAKLCHVSPHTIQDSYINQRRQIRGLHLRTRDQPFWKPPDGFLFNDQGHINNFSGNYIKYESDDHATVQYFESVLFARTFHNNIYHKRITSFLDTEKSLEGGKWTKVPMEIMGELKQN